jgi:hypothetical protein
MPAYFPVPPAISFVSLPRAYCVRVHRQQKRIEAICNSLTPAFGRRFAFTQVCGPRSHYPDYRVLALFIEKFEQLLSCHRLAQARTGEFGKLRLLLRHPFLPRRDDDAIVARLVTKENFRLIGLESCVSGCEAVCSPPSPVHCSPFTIPRYGLSILHVVGRMLSFASMRTSDFHPYPVSSASYFTSAVPAFTKLET